MKVLRDENIIQLTEKVYDLIARTSIEIGHKTDGKTMASLAKIFASDLQKETRFGLMTFNQVQDAFHIGVRFGKDEPFLNIRTFYKWTYAHKQVVDHAEHQVRVLKMDPEQVAYYQEPIKLLK